MFSEKEKLFHRPPFSAAVKEKYGNNETAQRKIKEFAKTSKNLRRAILWRFSTTRAQAFPADDYQYDDAKPETRSNRPSS